jgi:hypothetical protein
MVDVPSGPMQRCSARQSYSKGGQEVSKFDRIGSGIDCLGVGNKIGNGSFLCAHIFVAYVDRRVVPYLISVRTLGKAVDGLVRAAGFELARHFWH